MWKKTLGIEKSENRRNQEWKVCLSQTLFDMKYGRRPALAGSGDYGRSPRHFWECGRPMIPTTTLGGRMQTLIELAEKKLPTRKARKIAIEFSRKRKRSCSMKFQFFQSTGTTRVYLISPDVKNWNPLLLDNHPYKHIDLVPSGQTGKETE